MKKPLELVNYVPATCEDGCCPKWANPITGELNDRDWDDDKLNVERQDYPAHKRFTDAELAAEAYRQMLRAVVESGVTLISGGAEIAPGDAVTFGPIRKASARLEILHRFATLPHYDEVA